MNSYWTEAAQLYLILHQSCFSLKSDPQDLLRSFTFTVPQRRNDLHLTSSEDLSIITGLHCIICLNHFNLILLLETQSDDWYFDHFTSVSAAVYFRSFGVGSEPSGTLMTYTLLWVQTLLSRADCLALWRENSKSNTEAEGHWKKRERLWLWKQPQ